MAVGICISIIVLTAAILFLAIKLKISFIKLSQIKQENNEVQSLGKIGYWHFNLKTNHLIWSNEHYKIFEIEVPQTSDNLYDLYRKKIPHEDILILDKLLDSSIKSGIGFTFNHRVMLDNGKVKHVRGTCRMVNKFIVSGTSQDLTEQIQNEEKLFEKEQLLSSIIQNLPVAIFGKDINNNFQWCLWNKKSEELFGIKTEDALGKYDTDFFPKEQSDFFRAKDVEAAKVLSTIDIPEEELLTTMGLKFFHTKKVVIQSKSGRPLFLIGISEDITDAKNRISELNQEKVKTLQESERFKAIFLSSDTPILVFNEEEIIDCNPAAVKILGATDKQYLMSHHPVKFSPEFQFDGRRSCEKSLEMDRIAKAEGRNTFEWIYKKLDGTELPVIVNLIPINWDNELVMFAMWNDQTEIRKKFLKDVQISKMISLGEMAAGMAHEINNPLAIISMSLTSILKNIENRGKIEKNLEILSRSTKRITKLVSGLKKFSRNSEDELFKYFNLRNIIKETIVLTGPKAKSANVMVSCDCDDSAFILCDEVEIEQVLINLINNAIDAVELDGKDEKWVKISLEKKENSIYLRVSDSGKIISNLLTDKLFEPFYTTKALGKGTGLGLSITKGILDRHSATICLVPDMPNTCFEICFSKVG